MLHFFTIPDPELIQESSVDPMGMQVIWTHYGQAIFRDRITTVANNLRVFSFNLFHAHLIHRLFQEYPEEMAHARQRFSAWKTELDVKTGLLIFLEDVVTWVFYDAQQQAAGKEFQGLGTLGLSKARMADNSENVIYLSAYKNAGLLKRQLLLGMTGRYKGPMVQMGFFNRSFEIKHSQNKTWDNVEKLMQDWTEGMQLQNHLLKLITLHLLQSTRKDYPQLAKAEMVAQPLWHSIAQSYIACFGKKQQTRALQEFWKDQLGLTSGASSALYHEIAKLKADETVNRCQVFNAAAANTNIDKSERDKLKAVIAVEPFLSHTEYLLRYLAQPGLKKLDEETIAQLEHLRAEILNASHFDLHDAPAQLRKLHTDATSAGDMRTWILTMLQYHKQVMQMRGGSVWCELNENNQFKHYFAPKLGEKLSSITEYLNEKPWLHSYYLETLQSIHAGLN